MWLFDDLLKKPPQPPSDGTGTTSWQASGGTSGQQNDALASMEQPAIKIEKTNEQSILTDSVTPIAVSETPSSDIIITPSPVVTETNPSSIIVNGETVNITPIVTPVATEQTVTPITQQVTAPISTENQSPLIIPVGETLASSEQTSSEKTQENTESPVNSTVDLGNLFGGSNETTAPNETTPITWNSEVSIEEPTLPGITSTMELAQEESSNEEGFLNLKDYIKTNIEQTDALIARINSSHEAKLEEAAGYKSEKERYAELETTAYQDAEKMVSERLHAEKMKEYFIKQLEEETTEVQENNTTTSSKVENLEDMVIKEDIKAISAEEEYFYDEPPMEDDITLIDDVGIEGSVETALTGLAVQNSVKSTVEKKQKTKKHEEKKVESFSLV